MRIKRKERQKTTWKLHKAKIITATQQNRIRNKRCEQYYNRVIIIGINILICYNASSGNGCPLREGVDAYAVHYI